MAQPKKEEKKMYKGIYDYVEITDIKDLLGKSEAKYGDKPAFKFKTNVPG